MPFQKIAAVGPVLTFVGSLVVLGAALVTILFAQSIRAQNHSAAQYSQLSDFQKRTLLIMDPNVVADPVRTTNPCTQPSSLRAWSFGALMKEIVASDDTAAVEFMKRWLEQFITDQNINGQTLAARNIQAIWDGWQAAKWDIKRVPFQLLAIVNRIDLFRSPLLAGENAGEIRFVFGAVDLNDTANCASGIDFTVILEYGVRRSSCADLQAWANQWVALSSLDPSDPNSGYLDHLQTITDSVTWRNKSPTKPNGSAIDHVRTNEAVHPRQPGDWQLREFRMDPASRRMLQDTVTLTPMDSLNESAVLTAFLDTIADRIAVQDYWLPQRFPSLSGSPLLGAAATAGTAWQTSPPNASYLQTFAENTCSGCHGGLANSSLRVHIDPVMPHDISPFLLAQVQQVRDYGLKALAQGGCSASLSFKGLVH
jgi:hypothetical protein